jgi:hypothetical protein
VAAGVLNPCKTEPLPTLPSVIREGPNRRSLAMKFVDELPAIPTSRPTEIDIDALRDAPGRWAEVARYAREKRNSASQRGHRLSRQYQLEYATRTDGDEVVLYMRAVPR